MPAYKRGLSGLARAEAGLNAKQLRRSMNDLGAAKSKVQLKTRSVSFPDVPVAKPEQTEEPASETPPS